MAATTNYVLYFAPESDNDAFVIAKAVDYKEDKSLIKIATMTSVASGGSPGLATHSPAQNVAFPNGGDTGIMADPAKLLAPGLLKMSDGTQGAPTYSFLTDPNSGMYQYGDDQVAISVAGTARFVTTASGIYVTTTVASDVDLQIDGSSGLVTKASSSKRYKDNIEDLDINTENIYDLRPVSFDWKSNGKSDFGFIAEEVHEILPELTIYDDKNRPEAVKYKQLAILMLEELKKLRSEVKELKEKN
jgi:hypothetical protein